MTHPRTEELAGHRSTRTFATIVGRFFCTSCAATVDACPAHRATPRSETLRSRGHGNEAQQTITAGETTGLFCVGRFHSHPRFLAPNNVYSRHTLISPEEIRKMPDEEWINTLEDGRKMKFIYQELPEDGAFITAQLAGNEVVYSVILTKAGNPPSREDVESHFEGELSKK
jgi:hypothetical protein